MAPNSAGRGGVPAILGGPAGAAEAQDRERRCLTMIAYAEAGGEGSAGMLAVMKVVRNRIADPSFADDACSVALEPGQFQPVAERPALRRALASPFELRALTEVLKASSAESRLRLIEAWRACAAAATWPARDPTGRRPLLRQSATDGSSQVPVVRRAEAHGRDRTARVHDGDAGHAASLATHWGTGSPAGRVEALFQPWLVRPELRAISAPRAPVGCGWPRCEPWLHHSREFQGDRRRPWKGRAPGFSRRGRGH